VIQSYNNLTLCVPCGTQGLPGTVSVAHGGQRAVERQQSQVGDVVRVPDRTPTLADDTRSVMSVQFIRPLLYTLRPLAALTVHRLKLADPLAHLHIVTSHRSQYAAIVNRFVFAQQSLLHNSYGPN